MKQKVNEDYSSSWNKVLRFLSFRPRTKFEIETYLTQKKVQLDDKIKIIEKLEHLKLIDDTAFINWWVEQRSSSRPRSIRVLKLELSKKGIAKELVELVLSNYSADDEQKSAESLAEKRLARIGSLSFLEQKKKLFQLLASRGFSYEIIQKVVDKLVKKE